MTTEIALTLLILAGAVVLFITERLRLDLTALLVLAALTITGLVTPEEALSGFSNTAVVTVWAVFILSAGLTNTGVADIVGQQIMRVGGQGATRLVIVIMVTSAVLSGFMNNIGVAAMMMPIVVTIASQARIPPSKLLMPLSVSALIGGMLTLIGTPPNILAASALAEAGLQPFSFFDFTPMGAVMLLAGVAFMVLVGPRLLPSRNPMEALGLQKNGEGARDLYGLEERLALIALPADSRLAGKSLSESRIGAALGLTILGTQQPDGTLRALRADSVLHANDSLLALGRLDRLEALSRAPFLEIETWDSESEHLVAPDITLAELVVDEESPFAGRTLAEINLGQREGLFVLVINRGGRNFYSDLPYRVLEAGDRLLVQGDYIALNEAAQSETFAGHLFPEPSDGALADAYGLQNWLLAARIPQGSLLDGRSLADDDLPGTFGLAVIAIVPANGRGLGDAPETSRAALHLPRADTVLAANDVVWLKGRPEDLDVIRSLQELEVNRHLDMEKIDLESAAYGLAEVVPAPRSRMFDRTLREIHFREKYGLSVLAIWRNGRAYRSDLGDMPIRPGDALLVYGPREQIRLLEQEPDFVVLSSELPRAPARNRAPVALLIMGLFVLTVLLGWLNVAVAAVIAAALMVLSGCLSMDEAYQAIDWRAVFLIAGMLPLGLAMESSGTAEFLANGMVRFVGQSGGLAVVAGFFLMTNIASQFMPSPVVTVLMAPIAITTAADLALSPYAVLMAVVLAASASFMTPVGHPANVLVMGPGGYRFADFVKVGLPLTLLVLVLTLLVLPLVWPLQAVTP